MYSVIKYIHGHIDEKLTVSELAKRFGYSKWYFCDLFKQFFGTTFVEYVRNYRMQLAMLEIMDGKKCVDVAVKYGYETQSGFNKAFLKEFGCLPREFRQKSEAFHLAYKERKKDMYKFSDRCAILREGAVIKKTLNRKICGQRSVLFSLGIVESFEAGIKGKESVRAAGIANVIKNSVPYIQEGELIVGYNYADAPLNDTWRPRDNENDRALLLENGFKQEQIDRYFETYQAAKGCIPRSEKPVFDKTEKELDEEWAALGRCVTDNHSVIGYEQVLTLGFEGILSKAESCEAENGNSDLYGAMKILCRAGLVFGEKYADLAKKMQSDPTLSSARVAELRTIENTCRRVPAKPAESFREAVQSLFFAHIINTWEDFINANSLGRLDQILYPYYKHDIEKGFITREEAFELICCLWIKLYRDYDVQQSCVGGCTKDGKSAVNELSYMMLDATEELDFVRCLSVRFSPVTEKKFLRRALEVVGHVQKGIPFFFNDDVLIPALVSKGVLLEDARDYTQIGCVETVIPGKSNPHAVSGETNLLKAIEYAFANGRSMFNTEFSPGLQTGKLESFETYEEFEAAVFRQIFHILDISCKKVALEVKINEIIDSKPYKALLTEGCMETNRGFNNHGAKYDNYEIMLGGVPNLADSLMVIKKLVYEDRKYTLGYFYEQLLNDFPSEAFRQECIHKTPKFGNDFDEVDDIAIRIINYSCDALNGLESKYNLVFYAQPFTYLWMLDHGRMTAATPDGRKKGEIIAYSVSPMQGRDFSGFTALLNSISKLPTKRCPGTTSAIVEVDPKLFTDSNIDRFADILISAAKKGLSNVQFNTIDAETLIDAQKYPEKYSNLAVRVSGFSQKFVLLDKKLQDHIIGRTKHKCL